MTGFFDIYDETDRVELGRGFWVDIRRHLDTAAWSYAQRKLVDPKLERKVTQGGKENGADAADTYSSTFDQQAYNLELLCAAIVDWNITERDGTPTPLPTYIPPTRLDGEDKANRVRRESIGRLPAYATKKILAKIEENEKLGADASFPGDAEEPPATA